MAKFQVDIYYAQNPKQRFLGTVYIEAHSEVDALHIAERHTQHWVVGKVDSDPVVV